MIVVPIIFLCLIHDFANITCVSTSNLRQSFRELSQTKLRVTEVYKLLCDVIQQRKKNNLVWMDPAYQSNGTESCLFNTVYGMFQKSQMNHGEAHRIEWNNTVVLQYLSNSARGASVSVIFGLELGMRGSVSSTNGLIQNTNRHLSGCDQSYPNDDNAKTKAVHKHVPDLVKTHAFTYIPISETDSAQ